MKAVVHVTRMRPQLKRYVIVCLANTFQFIYSIMFDVGDWRWILYPHGQRQIIFDINVRTLDAMYLHRICILVTEIKPRSLLLVQLNWCRLCFVIIWMPYRERVCRVLERRASMCPNAATDHSCNLIVSLWARMTTVMIINKKRRWQRNESRNGILFEAVIQIQTALSPKANPQKKVKNTFAAISHMCCRFFFLFTSAISSH